MVELLSPARPDARLARQVKHDGRAVDDPREVRGDEVRFLEGEVPVLAGGLQVSLLALALVVVTEAVDADDVVARGQQALAQVRADETGCAGDDYARWRLEHSDKSAARDGQFATATYLLYP